MLTLYAAKGGGSMIVEAVFAKANLPLDIQDVDWKDTGWDSPVLKQLNPLGQVPTLKLADGTVLTESAAIVLWITEEYPEAELAPLGGDPLRPVFLRWLIFLVSAVYPTFTYGDLPERWVGGNAAAAPLLKAGTDAHRQTLFRYVESQIQGPWFLGRRWSVLDLYLWAMTGWRPGRAWFETECPKIAAIAAAMAADPVYRRVALRNE